jgi:Mn-dependent DtxR family transcriptional regulator
VNAEVRLSRSRQDYLKALYALAPGGEPVPTSRLAAQLGVSPPSVTHMLGRLAGERLVIHAPRAGARLTARGHREALGIVRRHRILETFLVRVLGLDWSEVHEDAEVLEHHISDRVLAAIDRLIGHPDEDPHGHPIPDRAGRMRRRALTPLAALNPGGRAVVREIRDADGPRMARWKAAGLVPGAEVRVRAVRALEDVFELSVSGRRLVTGSEGLAGVMVEVGKSTRRRTASAPAVILVLLAGALGCATAATDARSAEAPAPIADNSFLLEEGYNQEARVIQHIGTWTRSHGDGAWDLSFTQEWPVGGQRHQLSYTIPFRRLSASEGDGRGFGDIGLNYRFQWSGAGGGPIAFAPRLTALLASGTGGLGAGRPGLQLNLPLSAVLSPRWVAHTNAGATWRVEGGMHPSGTGPGTVRPRRGVNLGQSLIWLPAPTLNLMLELAWDRTESEGVQDQTLRDESLLLAPGFRWARNFPSGLQVVPGVAVPIGLGPSRGQRSLFLYLSVEHGF